MIIDLSSRWRMICSLIAAEIYDNQFQLWRLFQNIPSFLVFTPIFSHSFNHSLSYKIVYSRVATPEIRLSTLDNGGRSIC